MKINWITDKDSWAFRNICESYSNNMKNDKHEFDSIGECDINYVCSPTMLGKRIEADESCILHMDSNRWYEALLK